MRKNLQSRFRENSRLSDFIYIVRTHVYKFGSKVKIDISTIPVQKETENTFKSLVSGERIAIPRRVFTNLHKNGMYGVEVIHLSEENLQKAERLGLSLVLQSFRKRYWYKFGFKKALDKRIKSMTAEE